MFNMMPRTPINVVRMSVTACIIERVYLRDMFLAPSAFQQCLESFNFDLLTLLLSKTHCRIVSTDACLRLLLSALAS